MTDQRDITASVSFRADTAYVMSEPKSKAPAPVPAAPDPLAPLADELGEIDKILSPHRTRIARETALKSQLRERADTPPRPADAEIRIAGTRFDVILGARAMVKTIHIGKLVKAIGAKAFHAFARATLADVEAHAPDLPLGVITSDNSGFRSLKIFEKAA